MNFLEENVLFLERKLRVSIHSAKSRPEYSSIVYLVIIQSKEFNGEYTLDLPVMQPTISSPQHSRAAAAFIFLRPPLIL